MKRKIFTFILSFLIFFGPLFSFNLAFAKPIVPNCGKLQKVPEVGTDGKPIYRDKNNDIVKSETQGQQMMVTAMLAPCDFDYLMQLINNVIDFLLFIVATPLVAIILCYAGFLMITAGGNSEKAGKAKHILTNVIFGYIIALIAWLVINSIMSALGFTGPSYLKG